MPKDKNSKSNEKRHHESPIHTKCKWDDKEKSKTSHKQERFDDRKKRRLEKPIILKENKSNRRLLVPEIIEDDDLDVKPTYKSDSASPNKYKESRVQAQKRTEVISANFGLSGKLTADTNTFNGVVIKYNEPPDAKKPTEFWRLYPFKGSEALPILHIHRQSGFLIGRDRKIADIPMDHPSISKQHAVLQFRCVKGYTRLYIIDLDSANGTYLNNNRIESKRYYELKEQDMLKFGFSSRDFVVMIDDKVNQSKDDDV